MPSALDEFEEDRSDGAGIEVDELAVAVTVVKQAEFAEPRDHLVAETESSRQVVVVVVRHGEERRPADLRVARHRGDVGAFERDVLRQVDAVEDMRRDVQRDAHRAVGRAHHLAAHQPRRAGDLGGRTGGQAENAGEEQLRVLRGLPGL
jgi:hypothetical protein